MKALARKHGITVSVDKGKVSVTDRKGKEIAGGVHYEKEKTFMMNIKGKDQKFTDATDIITYMTKHKIVETTMNEKESTALGLFGELLKETAAQDSVRMKNPKDQGSMEDDSPDNKKTGKDVKSNKGAKSGADKTLKTHPTSKSDSESQDSEAADNKATRKKIEGDNSTKEADYPGK